MGIQGEATRTNFRPFGGHECLDGGGSAESRKEMVGVMCVLVFPATRGYSVRYAQTGCHRRGLGNPSSNSAGSHGGFGRAVVNPSQIIAWFTLFIELALRQRSNCSGATTTCFWRTRISMRKAIERGKALGAQLSFDSPSPRPRVVLGLFYCRNAQTTALDLPGMAISTEDLN